MSKLYCEKCGRTKDEKEFYTSNNLEKYKNDGKLLQCKECLTMHVDNWDPETYKWILEEIDVPYIKDKWDEALENYLKKNNHDVSKMTGMSILGRYLSTMKLKQWVDKRWADTEAIEAEIRERKVASMRAAGKSDEDIAEELGLDHAPARPAYNSEGNLEFSAIDAESQEPDEFELSLTEEDKIYLRLKWGKAYTAEEWVRMEQLYEDMMASYDIQTAGHKDTLIMLCKTSMKANQLIDAGDLEGYQKMSKVYDALMKSGKFTAMQNKEERGEFIDSIGELVALCEKEGFIPRYYVDGPKDKVDRTLEDLQTYTRTLVTEEMNLGNMIEAAMKQIVKDKENEAIQNVDDGLDDEENMEKQMFAEENSVIQDEDILAMREFEARMAGEDEEYLLGGEDEPLWL